VVRIAAAVTAAVVVLLAVVAGAAGGLAASLTGRGGDRSIPSTLALADIPPDYLVLYQAAAATCPGLDWTILAAIGSIESDNGRSTLPGVHSGQNEKGAMGPMQFLAPTFAAVTARHPPPPGGAAPPSPYDPHDAVFTAAAYLCDSGARAARDLPGALFSYNHSDDYVAAVLTRAARYRAVSAAAGPAGATAARVVAFARAQLGQPYLWGGDGPAEGGFDCSGLTRAAYAAAGIAIPRTADAQYRAGPPVPPGQPLEPGDLIFYGNPASRIHHVGVYIGHGQMIHAPDVGLTVRVSPYRWAGDDFAGASRPVS
jgi:cell wall-associated NlpC family hydrolase